MSSDDQEDTTLYKVVVNHEEQYSIRPADRENPPGWKDAGKSGLKDECLAYINEVWTDMRPLSLRKQDVVLSRHDVHVWCASLQLPAARVDQLLHTLSPEERTRAERFHFEKDRAQYIAGRGILRALLARYAGTDPSRLQFIYGTRGKPALTAACGGAQLCFNVSHSHGLALYAVTHGRALGVDIEHVHPIAEADQLAARFFSERERRVFHALPAGEKQDAFFRCWTRKEAYVKACGDGLARPLDQFEVSLAPGEPAQLLAVQGDSQEVARWSMRELKPASGYVAALAVEGHGWHLTCWQWPE